MSDFTEVSNQGWLSRIKNAFAGMVFGLLLTVGAVVVLFWNEGRSVKRYETLKEGQGSVISVSADSIDPANEGKLVHLSGVTEVKSGPLTDATFGVTETAVKLKRIAEMYQWDETKHTEKKKNTGGSTSTRTTYSYSKKWMSGVKNSDRFKERAGHENPKSMPYSSQVLSAKQVDVGAFTLAPFLIGKINNSEAVEVASLDSAKPKVREQGKLNGGGVYFGEDPGSPQIGDTWVKFSAVREGPVSLVAQQVGNSFQVYQAKHGTIELLAEATKSADEMFADAHTANKMMTWAIRGGGFLLMALGIGLLFKPLSVLADVIPFVGSIVGAGTGFIAAILAGIISFTTIAIAWIFYRPVLGISLIVIAVALLVMMFMRISKKKAEAAQNQQGYAGSMGTPPPLG